MTFPCISFAEIGFIQRERDPCSTMITEICHPFELPPIKRRVGGYRKRGWTLFPKKSYLVSREQYIALLIRESQSSLLSVYASIHNTGGPLSLSFFFSGALFKWSFFLPHSKEDLIHFWELGRQSEFDLGTTPHTEKAECSFRYWLVEESEN